MTDQFMEEATVKQNRGAQNAMYIMAWVLMILFGVVALYFFMCLTTIIQIFASGDVPSGLINVAILLVSAACCALLWFKKDTLKTEYDYTITNSQMDFAAVYNNQKRKALGTMNLKNISACGDVTSGSFRRYIEMPGIKRKNWFVNREANLFYLYYKKNDVSTIIIIEPSDEMKTMIKHAVAPGVYQVN